MRIVFILLTNYTMTTKAILGGVLLLPILMGSTFAAKTELQSAQSLAAQWVINSGSSASDFGLSQTITRKEMMKVTLNLSGKSVPDTCNGSFSDVENDWGCKYIEAGLANGLIAANATFRPNDTISKAGMNTALDNGIIASAYSDHNSAALRGWIFSVGAAESHDMMDKMEDKVEDTMKKDDEVMMDDKMEDKMMKNEMTGYKDYDESLLGQNDTTVLFFNASWCPSCRAADASLSASSIDDILVLSTDYDNNTDLRKKYGVTSQHTFVQVDAQGEMIQKWSGGNDIESIRKKVQ